MTGRIKTLFSDRRCQDGGDVFLHAKNVAGLPWEHLAVGDQVWFDVADDPQGKGPCAVNVSYMPPANSAGVA